jgi:hypothetical protein
LDSVRGWAVAAQVSPDTVKNNLITTHDSDFKAAVRKPRAHEVTHFLVPDPERYPNALIADRWPNLYAGNQPGFELVKEFPKTPEKWRLYEVAIRQEKAAPQPEREEEAARQQSQVEYLARVGDIQSNCVEIFLDTHEKLLRYDILTTDDLAELKVNESALRGCANQVDNLDPPRRYAGQYEVYRSAINELHEATQLAYSLVAYPTVATKSEFDEYDRRVNEAADRLQQSNEILGRDYRTIGDVQEISPL